MPDCFDEVGRIVCAIAAEQERGLCWTWLELQTFAWSLIDWHLPWIGTC